MNINDLEKEAKFAFGDKFWEENKEHYIKAIKNIKLSVGDIFIFEGNTYVVDHVYLTHEGVIEAAYLGSDLFGDKEYGICKRQSSLEKAGSI